MLFVLVLISRSIFCSADDESSTVPFVTSPITNSSQINMFTALNASMSLRRIIFHSIDPFVMMLRLVYVALPFLFLLFPITVDSNVLLEYFDVAIVERDIDSMDKETNG